MNSFSILIRLIAGAAIFSLVACGGNSDNTEAVLPEVNELTRDTVLEIAVAKYRHSAEQLEPSKGFPRNVENGEWRQANWLAWTNGFYAGVLWKLATIEPELEPLAVKWTLPLEDHLTLEGHDLGFIFTPSFGHAFEATADSNYLNVLNQAAANLSARFNERVGATRSWDFGNYTYPVIIDNLMNLELLFDVSALSAEERYYQQAQTHAITSSEHHIREDGSTFHLVDFDPETGEVLSKQTVQGAADSSTWARGQAWALYGFSMAYRETGHEPLLTAATEAADYYIEHLPQDNVPYWDFSRATSGEPKDTSAGAIAASGLWQLAELVDNDADAERYRQRSTQTVQSLMSDAYFDATPNNPALLRQATGNKPSEKEVNTSLIYADYYFIEALLMQISDAG